MSDYTEHARLSPSGSKKWMACAGSITLEELVPPKASIYADEGTACHAVAAWCLTEHWQASKRVGEDIPVHGADEAPRFVEFTEEMAEWTQEYVDNFRHLAIGNEKWIETRVEFSSYVGVPDQFGTLDGAVYLAADKELQIHDAKFGHRPVEVVENSQLMFYALGMYAKLELAYDIERIRLFIHQPKVRTGPTEWMCTVGELMQFAEYAKSRAQLVELAGSEWKRIHINPAPVDGSVEEWSEKFLNPTPNEDECAFCRAMPTCPNAQAEVQRVVGMSFEAIAEAPPDAKSIVPAPGPQLDTVMAACGFLEDFVLAVRAVMEGHLLSGGESAAFGLELGRQGPRRWSDPTAAEKMLREVFRLTIEDSYNLKVKSPTQVEKMAGMDKVSIAAAKPKRPKKGEAPTAAPPAEPPVIGPTQWKRISSLIVRSPPKPSVKPKGLIKVPYSPPPLDAGAFEPVVELDDMA